MWFKIFWATFWWKTINIFHPKISFFFLLTARLWQGFNLALVHASRLRSLFFLQNFHHYYFFTIPAFLGATSVTYVESKISAVPRFSLYQYIVKSSSGLSKRKSKTWYRRFIYCEYFPDGAYTKPFIWTVKSVKLCLHSFPRCQKVSDSSTQRINKVARGFAEVEISSVRTDYCKNKYGRWAFSICNIIGSSLRFANISSREVSFFSFLDSCCVRLITFQGQ